jgi:hypothetical protein
MKVKVKNAPARPAPEPTYSITGLTKDEMYFLRDLTGRFGDNPGDGGIRSHFHTRLYSQVVSALGEGTTEYEKAFSFTGCHNNGYLILHCSRTRK